MVSVDLYSHLGFCELRSLGGDDGIRTHDPLLAGQVLSQLSYTPILLWDLLFLLFLTFGVDFTPLLRLVSALNYFPVQSPVKYLRHCRA